MKADRFTHTLLIAALATLATGAFAAEPAKTLGQREYEGHCAVCHGVTGKGDGPYAGIIETKMPDLTVLSKRNNGVFPVDRVYATIDGAATLKAHGTRVMPIWGQRYRIEAAEQYYEMPYDDQVFVRVRINALIDHMLKLQVK
jgi:mono/diheme cytochrome c family protein